jgi:hypothetical protein
MFIIILFALLGAGEAGIRAGIADFLYQGRASAKEGGAEPADISAINAKFGAVGMERHARGSAFFTLLRSAGTGIDGRLKFLHICCPVHLAVLVHVGQADPWPANGAENSVRHVKTSR